MVSRCAFQTSFLMPFFVLFGSKVILFLGEFLLYSPFSVIFHSIDDSLRINNVFIGIGEGFLQFGELSIDAFSLGLVGLNLGVLFLYFQTLDLGLNLLHRQMDFFTHRLDYITISTSHRTLGKGTQPPLIKCAWRCRFEVVGSIFWDRLFEKYNLLMHKGSSLKKKEKSPNEKLLKSFYSKQKSKSEYSPNANRSISKEQIKHQIKKVVYNCNHPSERAIAARHNSQYQEAPLPYRQESNRNNLRTSLTPKNLHYPKKQSQRQVRTSKASESRGKQLFVSTGRYDLKQLFDRRKEQESKQKATSLQKRNNYVNHPKYSEEETLKVNERNKDQYSFNVRAYLTADQYTKFGERFPENFKRVGLLGRGGFSVVWLGVHRSSKRKAAVKQILTKNPHETHLKEIWFGSYFFEKGGEARQEFQNHIGINNICRLYSHEIRTVDSWLYYELCDESLGSSLFELKGQSLNGQRFYKIEYKDLITRIREDQNQLKVLMVEVVKALYLINSHNIVHSDLKTENILLKTRRKEELKSGSTYIKGVKLIDFGSSFLFTNLKQFSMATPQYMPPEILNYILYQNKLEYDEEMLKKMQKYKNPWIIDIWSLGCIVLEIITGVPLWMSIDTKIGDKGQRVTGLFAVKNRVFSKIIQKQIEVVNNLDYHLENNNYSGIVVRDDIRKVLKMMLALNPEDRISPRDVLNSFGIDCEPVRIPSY